MCGILGIKIKNKTEKIPKNLYEIFKNQQSRGLEGAGISLLRNGELTRTRAKNPYDLFSFKNYKFWKEIKEGDCIIIHHRIPTCGSGGDDIKSNHPFSDENNEIHLIHNGMLSNHESMVRTLKFEGHKLESENELGEVVDSEVLVHLLERENHKGLKRITKELKGSMAISWLRKGTNEINLFRNGNPIILFKDEEENIYFSSEFPEGDKEFTKLKELKEGIHYKINEELVKVKTYKIVKENPYYLYHSYDKFEDWCDDDSYVYNTRLDAWVKDTDYKRRKRRNIKNPYL